MSAMTAVTYPEWLHAQIAELQRQRRRAQWRRYNASDKGRERVDQYRATVKGVFTRGRCALNQRMREHAAKVIELEGELEGLKFLMEEGR